MAKKKHEAVGADGTALATLEEMNESAVAILPYATAVGLNLPDDLTFEMWSRYARIAKVTETGTPWWIGDLINFAGDHGKEYGEQAIQKLHELGYVDQTLMNYGNIAAKFPIERRRMELTIAHHKMVLGMPKKRADDLLAMAIAKKWTTRELGEYRREQDAKVAAPTNGHVEKAPAPPPAKAAAAPKPKEPEEEREEAEEQDEERDEAREPDQAAMAGKSFPIDEDEWAEYANLCSKVRTEISVLDGWMTDPQERAVAEQYKALANTRDQIIEAMDQAEKFGMEPR